MGNHDSKLQYRKAVIELTTKSQVNFPKIHQHKIYTNIFKIFI